jgi:hypothetical protein
MQTGIKFRTGTSQAAADQTRPGTAHAAVEQTCPGAAQTLMEQTRPGAAQTAGQPTRQHKAVYFAYPRSNTVLLIHQSLVPFGIQKSQLFPLISVHFMGFFSRLQSAYF